MAVDDLFVPDGVFLKCDQGAIITNLKVNFKKHKLYGEIIATEKDNTPLVNIPSFGACSSTGSACKPTNTYWVNVHEGGTLVEKQKPLLETSFCKCMKGGNIKIFFSEADAIAALEMDKKERVDKIPYVDAILGGATMGPLNPLYLFTDTEPSDVGRGVRKGIKSTYHGLKQMVLHPIDTAKGLGKLAMTGVIGYMPPMTSEFPSAEEIEMQQEWMNTTAEERIAEFSKITEIDLVSTHEGIKASASEFYDQKIVHGTNAERGVLMGQTAEFIGELVVGSKGAGAAIKSAKGSAVAASASEKLSIGIATINEFVKATKLGKLAKSIKGIFKVGRKIVKARKITLNEKLKLDKLKKLFKVGENDKNLAYVEGQIDGNNIELTSISGKKSKPGSVEQTPFNEQQLKTKPTKEDINKGQINVDRRAYDSEVKALEKILKETTSDSSGKIKIVSDRNMCGSCTNAIEELKKLRPKIEVEKVYNRDYP